MRTHRLLLGMLAITGAGVAACTVPSMPEAPDGAKVYASELLPWNWKSAMELKRIAA
ncbi:hypothetical protein HTT03_09650 [Sulfitobacter sp. S0837]|uniref:hypothetical protein n=1 Tax=Sulfitobacter maritimus TaxID=2741719 RepID=UPI0015822AD0|nr:hypothetical protein [Sulfitobacter maritimus]NUH65548.1 hypothetical protein [Sulfitobacter maritimus]